MGTHTIHMDLSVKSVRNAIKELKKYEDDLTYKCQLLAEKLADRGIETAKMMHCNYSSGRCPENYQSMEKWRSNKKSRSFTIVNG